MKLRYFIIAGGLTNWEYQNRFI